MEQGQQWMGSMSHIQRKLTVVVVVALAGAGATGNPAQKTNAVSFPEFVCFLARFLSPYFGYCGSDHSNK